MGASCSKVCHTIDQNSNDKSLICGGKYKLSSQNQPQGNLCNGQDQHMHQLMKRSIEMYTNPSIFDDGDANNKESTLPSLMSRRNQKKSVDEVIDVRNGQYHLLYRQQQKTNATGSGIPRPTYIAPSSFDKENAGDRQCLILKENKISSQGIIRIQNIQKSPAANVNMYPTRLVVQRHPVRSLEEGVGGTHLYAVRWPVGKPLATGHEGSDEDENSENMHFGGQQEQYPRSCSDRTNPNSTWVSSSSTINNSAYHRSLSSNYDKTSVSGRVGNLSGLKKSSTPTVLSLAADVDDPSSTTASVDHLFQPSAMCAPPKRNVQDWVTISSEHNIYVADVGLSPADCDRIVAVTEQVCRGQYAAYTYAKQTLGCREFPELAELVRDAVHTITYAVLEFSATNSCGDGSSCCKHSALALDDREPHMVKYDVTKKERQKLDMHTDKSEWTFLMALSNGCGLDYSGGGTYFECLDSTVHIQRGHALIFPGKLRHCGQRIVSGLRFLLVGFLVDKSPMPPSAAIIPVNNYGSNGSVTSCKDHVKDDQIVVDPTYPANIP